MKYIPLFFLITTLLLLGCQQPKKKVSPDKGYLRFASYNVALYRDVPAKLREELETDTISQMKNIAAVIQKVRPDVLVLAEFDYDPSGACLDLFCQNYLEKEQSDQEAIQYAHRYQAPSNTGLLADRDMTGDGQIKLPDDAYGFGRYEGQYAFALLSKYPLDTASVRSFQTFLWKNMPGAQFPTRADGSSYYSDSVMDGFRLSSKNHVDIPIIMENGDRVHAIIAHPTPPVFDGPEDRNGMRNNSELRLIVDYLNNSDYLIDDQGRSGGLSAKSSFVVMGDLNADPVDGDAAEGSIQDLLKHSRVNQSVTFGDHIPSSTGGMAHNQQKGDKGDPKYDTSIFGMRIDYVLPSTDMGVVDSGIFWPNSSEIGFDWIKNKGASDHYLVWVDVEK